MVKNFAGCPGEMECAVLQSQGGTGETPTNCHPAAPAEPGLHSPVRSPVAVMTAIRRSSPKWNVSGNGSGFGDRQT